MPQHGQSARARFGVRRITIERDCGQPYQHGQHTPHTTGEQDLELRTWLHLFAEDDARPIVGGLQKQRARDIGERQMHQFARVIGRDGASAQAFLDRAGGRTDNGAHGVCDVLDHAAIEFGLAAEMIGDRLQIDAALGGNHPRARRGKALAREHPHRGMHELAASVLRRQRLLFTALGFRLCSDGMSARPAGAWRAARGRSGW